MCGCSCCIVLIGVDTAHEGGVIGAHMLRVCVCPPPCWVLVLSACIRQISIGVRYNGAHMWVLLSRGVGWGNHNTWCMHHSRTHTACQSELIWSPMHPIFIWNKLSVYAPHGSESGPIKT